MDLQMMLFYFAIYELDAVSVRVNWYSVTPIAN